MSEQIPEVPGIMISVPQAIHYTEDGATLELSTYGNIGVDERCEVLAEAYDAAPDNIRVVDASTAAGRLTVGFSKWRSSWDPHANDADPNLN